MYTLWTIAPPCCRTLVHAPYNLNFQKKCARIDPIYLSEFIISENMFGSIILFALTALLTSCNATHVLDFDNLPTRIS